MFPDASGRVWVPMRCGGQCPLGVPTSTHALFGRGNGSLVGMSNADEVEPDSERQWTVDRNAYLKQGMKTPAGLSHYAEIAGTRMY